MKTPMKIMHSEAATAFGGQEHRVLKEMVAMRERGHLLEAICQPGAELGSRLTALGFRVHVVEMHGAASLFSATKRIFEILRSGKFDVLNTHSRLDTVRAALAGRLARTPLIVRTRHLAKQPGSLLSYTRLPQRVVTVSEHVRQQLLKKGVPEAHVRTVTTGIEVPTQFVVTSTLRRELGLSQDDLIVGCVAHMRSQKGHDTLIEAMRPLMSTRPNLHLVLVGAGSPLLEDLKRLAASLGLSRRIHFLGARKDVENILRGFDVFALATRIEALGTAYIEASACGIPVVGTAVGGVPEVIQDDVTGFLVPPNDPAQLQAVILRLLNDPELRCRLGRAGYHMTRAHARFSVARMAEDMEKSYLDWMQESDVSLGAERHCPRARL